MTKDKIIEWCKANKKKVLIGVLIFLLICGYCVYKQHETVPVTTIQSNTVPEAAKAIVDLKISDKVSPAKVVKEINQAKQSSPNIVYVTKTQAEADKQANKIAKADKADAVIKQTEPSTNNCITSDSGITNNYYGLHLEKNNKLKAGVTVLDNQFYENLAYQHKKDEVIIHMQLEKSQPIKGVTYMRTLKEW